MDIDLAALPYMSRRKPLFATHGVVATSQPLAAQAGLAMLRQGGNAVDAALAAAITLTVVEPASNDVGGDTCAIVWDGTRLHALNGTGRAPAALTAEKVRARGNQEPGHVNVLEPGKRPYHTIIPGFLTRNGEAIGPFGVMGGHMQPQGHVQMIVNTIDYGMNPQASLDAPRWFWGEDRYVQVEPTVDVSIVEGLSQRGHEVVVDEDIDFVGYGQIIWRLPTGVYIAGSEGRTDGCAVGY
jgi:gamma-glutamyltranspeptidase